MLLAALALALLVWSGGGGAPSCLAGWACAAADAAESVPLWIWLVVWSESPVGCVMVKGWVDADVR